MGFNINQQPYFGDRKFYFAYRLPTTKNAGIIRRSASGIVTLRGGSFTWPDGTRLSEPSYQSVKDEVDPYGKFQYGGLNGKIDHSKHGDGWHTKEHVIIMPDSTEDEETIAGRILAFGQKFVKGLIDEDPRYKSVCGLTFKEVPMDATSAELDT